MSNIWIKKPMEAYEADIKKSQLKRVLGKWSLTANHRDPQQRAEKLKADLKTKTQDLDAKLGELKKLYSELKKSVKMDIEQSQWKEFGIEDKRS